MDYLPEDYILEFHADTLQAVRSMYNLDKPGEMAEAVDILDTWIKQQRHFVKKDFDRGYLERMIIAAKGSIERAKTRMDKLCTMRTLLPYFFKDFDFDKDFEELDKNHIVYTPLPKLTKSYERVYYVKNGCKNNSTDTLQKGFKLCAILAEYLKAHDYAASYSFVVDIRECNIPDFMTKVGILDMRNLMTLLTEAYGVRITGIHLFTNLRILDTLLILLRQTMSDKVGKRIKVHRSLESLYEVVPKEVLPIEYGDGGESRTVDEIKAKWVDIMKSEEFRSYYRQMVAASTDETMRQTDRFNDQYMGMPGTFRTLKVD